MSFTIDFRPRKDGLPYDPATFGGSVDLVRVYPTVERTGSPIATAGPATRLSAGLYRFTLPNLPDGTYHTSITWTEAAGDTPYTDSNDRFTLPVPDPLIARLRRLTNEPDPLGTYSDADMARYLDENTDLQGRVDVFAAAADVWDEKSAAGAEAGSTVSLKVTGDQTVAYAGSKDSPASMARRMRARSGVRTTRLVSPGARPYLLRPEQVDAGLGHAYGEEALHFAGLDDV